MRDEFYDYSRDGKGKYTFISRGKRAIVKIVQFVPTNTYHIYNLWFGDLPPGSVADDMTISDDGDIVKVLATVIQIVREFTAEEPHFIIAFKGNTAQRMALYRRILRTHYNEFRSEFIISALVFQKGTYKNVLFNPNADAEYWAFFVKRII